MEGIKETAKKVTDILIQGSVPALGTEWKPEDQRGLLHYDVLRMAAVLYVLSDKEQRNLIVDNTEEILGISHGRSILERMIGEMNADTIIEELYAHIPYAVGLFFELDFEKELKSLSYAFLDSEQALVLGIMTEDDELSVNDKAMLLRAWDEVWTNHLTASGISTKASLKCSIPPYQELRKLYGGRISDYIEIPDCENAKAVYDALKHFLQSDRISEVVTESSGVPVKDTYTRRAFSEKAGAVRKIELEASAAAMMRRAQSRSGDPGEKKEPDLNFDAFTAILRKMKEEAGNG